MTKLFTELLCPSQCFRRLSEFAPPDVQGDEVLPGPEQLQRLIETPDMQFRISQILLCLAQEPQVILYFKTNKQGSRQDAIIAGSGDVAYGLVHELKSFSEAPLSE